MPRAWIDQIEVDKEDGGFSTFNIHLIHFAELLKISFWESTPLSNFTVAVILEHSDGYATILKKRTSFTDS